MWYGVFYVATKRAKTFCSMSDELIQSFPEFELANDYCANLNMSGYIDELHSGYVVRLIEKPLV